MQRFPLCSTCHNLGGISSHVFDSHSKIVNISEKRDKFNQMKMFWARGIRLFFKDFLYLISKTSF